ncbi:conserved hypothetical protein [Leishmania major strain Friedlin]|uniref:Uncharacterized protein n=1 Tax=Leishmania major TaxID=5664 RepID=Q4QID5_LEIMA|nr:conserved hypothetical protein [Leishmania major strain Friedlin]CAG9569332.1 hypothetical_protein_-_conserved [Leishmania major strain Friedlin]CAJ02213.1 conserved hypothetical protein [Leishmania major strain Friedlin]|eukprot:XP_001681063.1 conserved hypothetical protein [Leishmania major strain Friedlin]
MHAGMRGPSAGHALRVHRTGSRTPTWSHRTTYATHAGSTRAAASMFLPCFVDDDERRSSWGHESLSSLGPSSWPQQPRVARRLAAAWQRACAESYRQAHVGHPMRTARRSSRCTWAFAAEAALRAHFQRALRWRSETAAPSAGDEELAAEAELRSMAAFVVETYVSLCKKPASGCRPGAALMLATRHSWGSSELQWKLLVLLVLADEVCAALGDSAACSTRASHWVSGVSEFSAVYECIIVVAAAQLCALRHAGCQRDVAGVAGTDTRHSEADAWEATAVAPHSVHMVRATRRLVEGVLAFCTKQNEGAILLPTRTDASDVDSLNSWFGGQLCCLAETSCCSLHPVRVHRDQRAALPEPLLLLLRLLVQSASWRGNCAAADVNGAQHLRHVCAAVLLIEHLLERASADTLAPCIDEVRGALWLSRRFTCGDEGAGDTVRQPTPTPRQAAWRRSLSSYKDARLDGGTAALAAATGRFVCQVLDGCPPSISRLLLLPGSAPQLFPSTMGGPATPLDREVLVEEVVLLAPGMALSAAWRLRHACAVGPLLRTSPTASAPALEHADAMDVAGARDGAASKCSGVGDTDSGEHGLLLQRRDTLEQVWSRLCPSSTCAAAALLPASWQALSSQFLSSILSQVDPPAIARMAEATLGTLRRLPPLLSAVHHEERARARRSAGAARLGAKAGVCGGTREGAGVAPSRSAVLALQCMLASAPTDAARAEASQALLSRLCTALTATASAQSDEEDNVDLTTERVHGAGVCLVVLLACASTSFRDQAAATHNFLAAVTSLVDSRGHPQHGRRESSDVYSALRSWWPGVMGSIMLARHAQLARGASRCAVPASTEHGSGEEPRRDPLASLSPAAQLALWWEEQSSLQADSAAPLPRLRDSCYWTGMRIMRLCNTAAHLAATWTTTSSALSSSQLPFSPAPSTADAEAARVACTAVYNMLSLEHVCHLAIASAALPGPGEAREAWNAVAGSSATAAPSPHTAHSSCACALATADAGVALFEGDLSSGDRVTSIFTHAMTAAREAGGGALNVLQHRQGRLLNDQQHESLVEAMRDFSKRRCVKEAVALFYAHERQYRRLRLAEVELFAETAKRAPLPFLVRLLLYVPPPCESAVLARAVIAGAWKAYQRALHRHSRRVAAAAAERRRGSRRENASLASRMHRQSCRRVEQAWYESLAVARRALALLPSAGGTDGCDEEAQCNVLALLQRFLCARPRSMQTRASPQRASSSSTGATLFADEWDSDAVQSAQLLAALLPSPSPSLSSSGSRQRLHVLRGASARGSMEELYQVVQLCDANNDPATAVRAYLRFASAHATSPPPSRLSRASAQDARKRSSPTVKANDGRVVPLLSLDTCVTLLRLASMHVVAACDEDAATYGVPVTASSLTRVPLTALLTYVEAHHVPSELSSPEAPTGSEEPRGGAVLLQNPSVRNAAAEDAEMTMLLHMHAALEESAAAPSDIVAEAATAGIGSTSKPVDDAMLGGSGYHAHVKGTPACAVSAAAAATSRAMTYATNCIAAVQRLSPTLPASLRCVLHSDSAAIPLTAVLHDALRWCRLRPQSVLAREGAATAVDGLDAAALHSLADRAHSDDPATADVVARLLAAVFQLDGAEMAEMVDAARPRPMHALVVTAAAAVTAADVAPAMADVAAGDVTSSVVVTRHTFACRAARANQDFWCLVRHSDALLSYVWDYLWELYRLESTVLWISPAQQQRAYLAVAECAQVILAALQALDVWAAEMRAHEAPERVSSSSSGSDGDGDYQAHEQASFTGGRSCVPMAASSEWRLGSSVDEWRVQLRSGILQRVRARLFDEGDLPDVTSGPRDETASTMLPCSLSSSGMPDTTSAAIAYMTTVMQHSSTAFESCAPTTTLMQLAGDPIAAASPVPSATSLSGSVVRTEGATSPREVRELLSRTTQQYYDALSRLASPSLPVSGGAGPLRPVHLSHLAMDSLSYVLRCVTATAAAAPPRRPHTIGTVAASEAGGTTALLSRVAAAEGMLRHVASLVQHASVLMEATDAAPRTAGVELLRTLWCLSGALQYAAALLDECMAWWTLLDLEAAAAPASELRGASDACSCDVGSVFPCVNGSLVARSALTHIRTQLQRLVASFADLYVSGWCGSVHSRLPEVTRARLWSRGESRAQHLRVCLVLQHLASVSGDAAVPARLVRAGEALQQALARYPSSFAAFTETKDARALQQSDFMELDELVDGEHRDVTESVDCTAAATVRTLERTLLAYLTRSTPPDGVLVIAPGHMTAVSITALEASFQRAVMTCLSPSHAALLWRLFTALVDDGCHPSAAVEDTTHEGSPDVPRPMRCERDAAAEGSLGVMCAVPTTLWRQLQRLGEESESDAASDVLRSSGACTEAPALHSERLAVYAALLSRHPLVLMGVVRHPLVRHHQLAEARREQWPPVQVGAGSGRAVGTSQAPSCEWLKKLLLYGEEDDSVAEAKVAASDDAGEPALSSAWTAAGRTLSRAGGSGLLRTSSAGALALLPAQPLRERFVSALILAVLRDASLMCDGPSCAPVAFVSLSVAAAVAAQRRECMLLELVQHLGYVAPHAVRTACRWITCTPYPPAACSPASSFPADALPPARLKCNALSCTDATTLRRLRVALLSCGPWPTTVARTLLEYATRVQRAATQEMAHAGDGETPTMPFPEALELYQRQQQQPESKRRKMAEAPQALMVTAQHQVDAVRGVRDRNGSGSAPPCGRGASASPPVLSTASDTVPTVHARGGRFAVGPSRPLPPAPAAPSSSLGSTRYGRCTGAGAPLSAIQLACEEGARLVKALRTSTAPAVWDAASRIVLRMCDLATAPSHPACVGLLSDAAFMTDLMALPTKRVAATVMLAWRTLLVRAAELDCREQNWDSAGDDDGVVAAEVHSRTRSLSLREAGSRDRRCMTVLDVYAMFFLIASRACDRLTASTPPLPRAKGRQWLVSGQRQLGSLKRELAAHWVAVLADEVMASQPVFQCSATSEAEAIRARIEAFCRSGADRGATRSPTLGLVTLEEHLRRAQARLQAVSQEPLTSSSSPRNSYSSGAADDKAAAELSRLQREASAQLRDAGAWLTSLPRPVTAEVSPRLAKEAAHASPERAWSLWPPAASETYQLRACMRKSSDENTLVTVTVRHPVSAVTYLCAWRREHVSAPQTRRSGARAERCPDSARTATVRPYDVKGATCVLLPAVCLPPSSAAQGSRQPGTSRGRAQSASQSTAAVSLTDVWRAADAYVRRGCLALVCVPRGGHGVASGCGPAGGSAVGAVEMDFSQAEVDSTATGTTPAGAGVVMQSLLGLVSLEDARLQQEQQQSRRQHAGLRSQSAVSGDTLQLLSVLRQLRQRLLSLAPAAAATVSGAHGMEGAVTTVTAEDKGDPTPAESPWAVFMPLSCVRGPRALPARRGGELDAAGSAWHSYLHVLLLCGDSLLCRVAQRRGRRASSSVAALTRVTHQLQRLASLSALDEQVTPSLVSSAFRSRLVDGQDAPRILCFQLRGLQHIRDHVSLLGWTVEQHRELQLAQQSIVSAVAAICALQHRSHYGQQCLQREDGWDAAATARIRLSTRVRRQVTAVMHEGPVHPVEQATAVCFYPALAHLLRQLSVTYPPSTVSATSAEELSSSRQRSPVEDREPRADDAAAEVVTEFAGVVATSARRRHRPLHPRAPQTTAATATAESDNAAAALLSTVYGALCEAHEQQRSGPTDRRQNIGGAHTSTTPTLTPADSCGELHALLSAVVAAVQRRSRDADPRLLLEFLSGNEHDALLPLAAAAEASYLETLMKAVALGASAPLPNDDSHRVVEAGLTLFALLHPWLPLSASARATCAMEAALSLVTLALQQRERLDNKRGAGTIVKSSATSLWYLVQVVLVSILHHQQPARLSVRSLVLLGVIYSQLRNLEKERGGVLDTVRSRRSSRTALQADASVLLWRILSALSALSEKDAAEVRDAWMSGRKVGVVARGPSIAEHAFARATDGAALTSVAESIHLRTETGDAKAEVCSGAHVIEVLYHGSLQALGEDGSGGGATEQVSGSWTWPLLLAATRLRTWLACEDVTAASPIRATASSRDSAAGATLHPCTASRLVLPQLCVLEEALCGMLKGVDEEAGGADNRSRTGRGATSGGVPVPLAVRRRRLACLRAYTLYAEMKRTCSAPLWRRPQGCLRNHAENGDSDSSRHDDDRSRRDGVGDVASLVLELAVVAALSAADASPHSRHSRAVSDEHQLALLSAFVRCCDALGTPLPSLPCSQPLPRWGQECSSATPAVASVASPRATGLGRVGVDAHAAVRHLATTLLFRLAEDAPLSAPSAQAVLHDWRAVLTPLQALRRVTFAFPTPGARLPEVDVGADVGSGHGSVWLLSTSSAGLQWVPVCQADPSSAKLAGCLDVSSSDADSGDGDASQPTGQQPQPQSQRRHCHHDQSLQGIYYTTLRLLWRGGHLAKLPLPVLLKELLRPLAELERAAAEISIRSPTATEAAQRTVRPTVRGRDDGAAGVNRKTANRLAALVDVAQQLSMHPVLSASAATAAAHDGDGSLGAGWTSACLVFKLLTQIEAALSTRCGKSQSRTKGSERAACAKTPCVSPSHAFAARYADLLAQRGTCAPDYLAFMLVVSRHCPELLPTHGGGAPGESEAHEERRRLLRHAQLRHAVALAAPAPAVGAVMELFQLRTAHCRCAMAAAQHFDAAPATGSAAAVERNTTRQGQRVDGEGGISGEADSLLGALTPDEQTLLQRLHHLLQTSRGKAAAPLRNRGTK